MSNEQPHYANRSRAPTLRLGGARDADFAVTGERRGLSSPRSGQVEGFLVRRKGSERETVTRVREGSWLRTSSYTPRRSPAVLCQPSRPKTRYARWRQELPAHPRRGLCRQFAQDRAAPL